MDRKKTRKITAIVPAYNEEERIGRVLDVLVTYPNFCEIIVVDDGSTDQTGRVACSYPVRYIKNSTNVGKGQAMDIGVKTAQSDIIFFVDADVSGLTHQMIDDITVPVINRETDMFIGMRNRKFYFMHSLIIFVPLLGGERALTKQLWNKLPSYYKHRFRVEAGLNFYAQYYGHGFRYKVIKGLSQTIKEKKYGLWSGLRQRFGMIFNIFSAQCKLHFTEIPKSIKNLRFQAFLSLQGLAGITLGLLMIFAAYIGPTNLILFLFANELKEDPTAPIINSLLSITNAVTVTTLATVGIILSISNFFIFLLTFKKLGYFWKMITQKIKNTQ